MSFGAKIGGEYVPAYFLENSNGARATLQTYGACVTEYVDKDGTVWLGKRADAVFDER
jgi:galactose mutarotase-like enzyme